MGTTAHKLLARNKVLWDALEDMVHQFAYEGSKNGTATLHTGGLSALEHAFGVLGWDDPHPVPERGCEYPGCANIATCGTPTPDGYKRLCIEHFMHCEEVPPHPKP